MCVRNRLQLRIFQTLFILWILKFDSSNGQAEVTFTPYCRSSFQIMHRTDEYHRAGTLELGCDWVRNVQSETILYVEITQSTADGSQTLARHTFGSTNACLNNWADRDCVFSVNTASDDNSGQFSVSVTYNSSIDDVSDYLCRFGITGSGVPTATLNNCPLAEWTARSGDSDITCDSSNCNGEESFNTSDYLPYLRIYKSGKMYKDMADYDVGSDKLEFEFDVDTLQDFLDGKDDSSCLETEVEYKIEWWFPDGVYGKGNDQLDDYTARNAFIILFVLSGVLFVGAMFPLNCALKKKFMPTLIVTLSFLAGTLLVGALTISLGCKGLGNGAYAIAVLFPIVFTTIAIFIVLLSVGKKD